MKTLLFVLLGTALSVQDEVAERVQLSKIKDIEKAKSNIKVSLRQRGGASDLIPTLTYRKDTTPLTRSSVEA